MSNLKLFSFNVRGINDKKKRRDVFNWLRKKNCDIYFLQETHSTKSVEQLWQNEWGYKAFFSSFSSNSRGVTILFNNSFKYELHNSFKDEQGRFIILDCTINGQRFTLANIYGPNEDNPTFFNFLKTKLEHADNNSLILGGDFNVVQDFSKDILNIRNRNNPNSYEAVRELKQELDLIDPWRELNPETKFFTWHNQQNKQSRLDYFLISSDILCYTETSNIKPGYRSDHSAVELVLQLNNQPKGRGIWKFNNSLLKDNVFSEEIKQCIKDVKDQYLIRRDENITEEDPEAYTIGSQLLFDMVKISVRGKTIAFASAKKRELNKQESDLDKRIDTLHKLYCEQPTTENLNNLGEAQTELKTLREKKIDGIIMRSKAKWQLDGERNTRYFSNLEKRHYQEKIMAKLVDDEGNEKTRLEDIVNEQKKYYQQLYTSHNPSMSAETEAKFFNVQNDFYTLTEEEAQSLEHEISLNDCYNVLKNMKQNKTPGSDGFTVEFYMHFWNDLKFVILNSFKESLRNGKLSDSQKLGVITCLPKPGKDKCFMKNWRPISLLNIDYKILAGVISNRLKTVLNSLISKCQKGFISGRYIGECTRTVSDLIQYLNKNSKPGIILMIDFEKAFDSLEWSFLEKTLKYFNFGSNIISWIKSFYNDIESCVSYNGHISERFKLGRGVRQGDPLSPYLFILCAEILARSILSNNEIKGIKVDDSEFILTQLADDTTFFLDNNEQSFEECIATLRQFAKISGLKINFSKTIAIRINMEDNLIYNVGQQIHWQNRGKFTLLGIKYDLDREDFWAVNYEDKCKEFQNSLNIWNTRNLSIYGKVCILKSLALSKLVHLFSSLPNPPEQILTQLQNHSFKFIWSGGSEKIKRTTMYNAYENGGFRVPNIKLFCMAQKVTWIKRILDDNNVTDWKTLFLTDVEKKGGNLIWLSNEANPTFLKSLNSFWRDVYISWKTLTKENDETSIDPRNQTLYYNKFIRIGGRAIYFMNWHSKGLTHVNDITNENGDFLSWGEMSQKYNIQNEAFRYISLINAVPKNWKKRIKQSGTNLNNTIDSNIQKLRSLKKPSRFFYLNCIQSIATKPSKAWKKWENYLGHNISEIEWKAYFSSPYKVTKSTKLWIFQQKILHKILPTNKWLFKCNLSVSPYCSFCHLCIESIEHLLWECTYSKNLWLKLQEWLDTPLGIKHNFTKEDTLLGNSDSPSYIENIKLITKHFIYSSKLKDQIPVFENLRRIISYSIKIEQIYMSSIAFERKWSPFLLIIN